MLPGLILLRLRLKAKVLTEPRITPGMRSRTSPGLIDQHFRALGRLLLSNATAGRDDRVPADGNKQTRTVSADPYPTTFGHKSPNPPTDILK